MKQRILSAALAVCLCIFFPSVVRAWQEESLMQASALTEESAFGMTVHDSVNPSPTEAYEAMIALKDQDTYKEGTVWTNYEPYSDANGTYHWKGGTIDGKNISAVGCVAFAFILSDAAFGSMPARMRAAGEFTYADIKTGDILRVNNDAHTVIVLEVSDAGVVVAEGNISSGDHKGKVHWGRAISKEEVMSSTSHYITRYPENYIPPEDPEANVLIGKGTFDGGLAWNLTKAGTLTISGQGAMPDFSGTGDLPWNADSSRIRKVVIEDGVTSIGSCAFWNCGVLSAEISSSVTAIGSNAFRGSSLISVSIPSSVKSIGDSAFRECQNLSIVTVFEGLETISQNAFRACTSLTSIALPASIGEVGAGAFFQCTAMTDAAFASGSKQVKMGDNLFTQCYYLLNVTLPQNIDCIGEGMFQNCLMLTGVEIPQGAESIGASAFASCSRLTAVIIPDSVTTIGTAAFTSCSLTDIYYTGNEAQWSSIHMIGDTPSAVSKATIHYSYTPAVKPGPGTGDDDNNNDNSGSGGNSGNGDNSGNGEGQTPFVTGQTFTVSEVVYKVTKAGEEVELTRSKSMAAKVIVNTVTGTDGVEYKVTSIGPKAMQNNKKMKNLAIGDNVKIIGANAFSGCTKLAAVTIGKTSKSSLTTIKKSAFNGCRKLGKVTIKSKKLSSVGKQAFKGTKSGLKVKAPAKQLAKYRNILKKAGLKVKQITK